MPAEPRYNVPAAVTEDFHPPQGLTLDITNYASKYPGYMFEFEFLAFSLGAAVLYAVSRTNTEQSRRGTSPQQSPQQ